MPEAVGHRADRAADGLGDGVSDREEGTDSSFPHVADVGEECFRGSGTVGADEDVGAVTLRVGDLRECLVEHRDVVARGVGTGVSGTESARQCLAGVGQEAQQRVEAEAAFIGGCSLLLLGVAGDQRGVEVQDQPGQNASRGPDCGYALALLGGLHPGDFPSLGTRRAQRSQCPLVGVGEQSPGESVPRRPNRTPLPGPAVRPGPRWPHRRRRASPPGRWRSGPDHARSRAAEAA